MNSHRPRAVGILLLLVFLLYGIGSSIATTAEPGPILGIGVALMLLNSLAVVTIGILLLPVLRPHSRALAGGYLATRVAEGALLGTGAIALVAGSPATNLVAYNLGMAALGLGSLFFCAVLYRARLVPRFIAGWGFAGYAVFAAGSVLELGGVAGVGLFAAIPGGLFELFLGCWLIVRGFGPRTRSVASLSAAAA